MKILHGTGSGDFILYLPFNKPSLLFCAVPLHLIRPRRVVCFSFCTVLNSRAYPTVRKRVNHMWPGGTEATQTFAGQLCPQLRNSGSHLLWGENRVKWTLLRYCTCTVVQYPSKGSVLYGTVGALLGKITLRALFQDWDVGQRLMGGGMVPIRAMGLVPHTVDCELSSPPGAPGWPSRVREHFVRDALQ